MLTDTQKQTITNLRMQGLTYAEIAAVTELSANTVKSFCHRNHIQPTLPEPATSGLCKNCGKLLHQLPGTKQRIFCSDKCRYAWWNKQRRKQPYHLLCHYCGREFISYGNRKRRFCGRECYLLDRQGEGVP